MSVEAVTTFASSRILTVDERGKHKNNIHVGFAFLFHRVAYVSVIAYALCLYLVAGHPLTCTEAGSYKDNQATDLCKSHAKFLRFGPNKRQTESLIGGRNTYHSLDEAYSSIDPDDLVSPYGLYPALGMLALGFFVYLARVPWEEGLARRILIIMSDIMSTNISEQDKAIRLVREMKNYSDTPFLGWYWLSQILILASFCVPIVSLKFIYHLDVLSWNFYVPLIDNAVERDENLMRAFPSMVGCILPRYGPSGIIEVSTSVCNFNNNGLYQNALLMLTMLYAILFSLAVADTVRLAYNLFCKNNAMYKNIGLNQAFLLMILKQNVEGEIIKETYKRLAQVGDDGPHAVNVGDIELQDINVQN